MARPQDIERHLKRMLRLPDSQLQELKSQLDRELEHVIPSFQLLGIAQFKPPRLLEIDIIGASFWLRSSPISVPIWIPELHFRAAFTLYSGVFF